MTQATTEPATALSPSDLARVKARQKAAWEDGDYASFAEFMAPGAVEILNGWGLEPGRRLLDVGCGAGQTALPAARGGLEVTGIDIAENLIDHARRRAQAEGLKVRFDVGDAEELPYEPQSFDIVISMIGAMFAPQPARVASELARVLRPGGRLYMANWTPRGMPAQMFKCVAGVVPPPPGFVPPVLWGDEAAVSAWLAPHFDDLKLSRRFYPQWNYPFTAEELVDFFRAHFGPVKRAFEACDAAAQQALHAELARIYAKNSETRNGVLTITGGEYLEIVATRR